jgi:hypothetical protein
MNFGHTVTSFNGFSGNWVDVLQGYLLISPTSVMLSEVMDIRNAFGSFS